MQFLQELLFRKLIILILIFIFFFAGLFSLKAQSDSTLDTHQVEPILKINQSKSPFSYGQTTWINNRGFNTTHYDWSNAEVNLELQKAIRGRNTSRAFLIIGPILSYIGFAGVMIAALNEDSNKSNEPSDLAVATLVTGGLMFYGSFAINLNARRKVKKAYQIR